ncbi:MAG TPA: archease [Anaerolineales bacterium]|nr:archease [Anaerolineales bacterium]
MTGYLEIEHTADWALTVWAPDLTGLLEQAARGMDTLSGVVLKSAPRVTRELSITGYDPEHLLVKFLTDILFIGEEEGLGFDTFELSIQDLHLQAQISGAPIASQQKEIKAVTYHDLRIESNPRGLETTIVFDV